MAEQIKRYEHRDISNPDSKISRSLISASVQWLQEINKEYGGDRGMEIWNQLSEAISPDLQIAVFRAMLSGNSSAFDIGVYGLTENHEPTRNSLKMARIRAIRIVSGMGLGEAKDLVENLEAGNSMRFPARTVTPDGAKFDEDVALAELSKVGFLAEIL